MRHMTVTVEQWPLKEPFVISRMIQRHGEVVVVEIEENGLVGRGECERMDVFEEGYPDVLAGIMSVKEAVEGGASRMELYQLLPSGAARNAVDCALFELDAKLAGVSAWQFAGGQQEVQPVTTVFTLSLGSPEKMAADAQANAHRPILKLKLGQKDGDLDRVRAVREAAPNCRLVIDANTGWRFEQLEAYLPILAELGVEMVEQPLSVEEEHRLAEIDPVIPITADESCIDRSSLEALRGRYQAVNVKLDKTGGFTEAQALIREAKAMGFDVMVGCMVGTSLAMAPALLLAQEARWVDIDGPLLLAKDRESGLHYDSDSRVSIVGEPIWGAA